MRSSCSRPRPSRAGRCGSPPASSGGARSWASSTGASRNARGFGVAIRCNVYAEAADVTAENPDVVVVATGGVPNMSFLDAGEDFAASTWDILSGAVKPPAKVLLYDDNGAHPGMTAAEFIAAAGSKLEVVTPERTLAPDVGGTSYPAYFRALAPRAGRRSTSTSGSSGSSGAATRSPASSSTNTASARW